MSTDLPGIKCPPVPLAGSEGSMGDWEYIPKGSFCYSANGAGALPWQGEGGSEQSFSLEGFLNLNPLSIPWCLS